MQSKSLRVLITVLVGLVFGMVSFGGGVVVGRLAPFRVPNFVNLFSSQATSTPTIFSELPFTTPEPTDSSEVTQLFSPFWQAWQVLHEEYVTQPVDNTLLMQGAIRGMLASLGDPHTTYMDPAKFQQMNVHMEGGYEGIGAWTDSSQEYLTIISPMPGSPAEKAGLKACDQVISVDGKDMTGIDGQLVIQRIMGPSGTQLTLTILRKGVDQPIQVTLTRARIEIPSVVGRMLDGKVAYVAIDIFGASTKDELVETLRPLLAQDPTGLIIDLRSNGGGYLETAIEVGSQFITSGPLLYERYGDGKEQQYDASGGGIATQIPLVILVNEGTASASEIVAGAVQDSGRGKLVGVQTYGKGSVQDLVKLDGGQGVIRVTIAHWFTPQKRLIDKTGLTPDIVMAITEADIQAKQDSQLQKAIELLTKTP